MVSLGLAITIYNLASAMNVIVSRIEYKPTPVATDSQPIDTMQEMTPDICAAMPTYSSLTLTDPRGPQPYQSYRVRKMPDNKCWMIDNLKLELTTGMQLTPVDSNVSANTTVTLGGPGTYTGNFVTSGNLGFNNWVQANPSDPSLAGTDSCVARNFVDPTSTTGCGYLYNWFTSTASSGTDATESGRVTSSICPKGWRLPRGNDDTLAQNEFAVLNSAMYDGSLAGMGYTTDTQYIRNWWHTGLFAGSRSGYHSDGFLMQGWYEYFWTSSSDTSNGGWSFHSDHEYLNPGTFNTSSKNGGFAVRCVAP
jgi:uncharacterized protein (TIGR02145 family)